MRESIQDQIKRSQNPEITRHLLYQQVCNVLRQQIAPELIRDFPGVSEHDIWEIVAAVAQDFLGIDGGQSGDDIRHESAADDDEPSGETVGHTTRARASIGLPTTPDGFVKWWGKPLNVVQKPSRRTPDVKAIVSGMLSMYTYKLRGRIVADLSVAELREMRKGAGQEVALIDYLINHTANAQGWMRVESIMTEEHFKDYVERSRNVKVVGAAS